MLGNKITLLADLIVHTALSLCDLARRTSRYSAILDIVPGILRMGRVPFLYILNALLTIFRGKIFMTGIAISMAAWIAVNIDPSLCDTDICTRCPVFPAELSRTHMAVQRSELCMQADPWIR